MDAKQIEQELDQLDTSLTVLKRDYEIYFSGGAKLPPYEAHRKLENSVRKYSRMTGLNNAQRFRYNNISARFNSYVDLWTKQMRYKEEGRTPSGGVVSSAEKPKVVTQSRPSEATMDKFQQVFNEYLKARHQTGEGSSALDFEKFSQQLARQKKNIVEKYQCKDVDFYVAVEEGKTKLKARPLK